VLGLLLVGCLAIAELGHAQDIGRVEYGAIRRGHQIASSCFANNKNDTVHTYNCLISASKQIGDDNYLRIGFTYLVWVVRAFAEDARRNDRAISDAAQATYKSWVRQDFILLKTLCNTLYLRIQDLCVITQSNCALAEKMESYWERQP
jgi:hypothetical protein